MKSVRDFKVQAQRVLVRCDFNEPVDASGVLLDDFRIRQALPTIEYLIAQGARVILMSHLGSSKGAAVPSLSLNHVQERLSEFLKVPVAKTNDCVGKDIEARTNAMHNGDVLLLENVRFHKEEEQNDTGFAKNLAALGDVFVNDAFSVSHRAHASVIGVPQLLPAAAGFLLLKEVEMLSRFINNIEHPFVAIVGGAKVKNKLSFVNKMAGVADVVLLGNLLANEAQEEGIIFDQPEKIVLPPDGVPSKGNEHDIGPKTIELWKEKIKHAKSIFWTGLLGLVEQDRYANGSLEIANAIVESKAFSVVGGGDFSRFLEAHNLRDKFSYVSCAGGAALAFLSGEKLPGLEALHYYDGD